MIKSETGRLNATYFIAAKRDGTILGLRVRTVANVGAYLQAFAPGIPTILHVFIVPGAYRIPAFDYEMRGAYMREASTGIHSAFLDRQVQLV